MSPGRRDFLATSAAAAPGGTLAGLGAVLGFAEAQVKAGRSRDEVLAERDPLTCAYEEVTAGAGQQREPAG